MHGVCGTIVILMIPEKLRALALIVGHGKKHIGMTRSADSSSFGSIFGQMCRETHNQWPTTK